MNQAQVLLDKSIDDVPLAVNQHDETNIILSHFFNLLFPAAITFGGVALIISIYRSLHHGWRIALFLNIAMYVFALIVLTFRHLVSARLKFNLFLALMAVSIIHSLLTNGLTGEAMMTLAMLCVFAGVFLGISAGIVAVITGVLTTSIIGALICTGVIRARPETLSLLSEPVTWAIQITLALLYVIPLILIINYMQKRTGEALAVSRESNKLLQKEIQTRSIIENELRESEARYRGIFENAVEGIFQSTPEGTLLSVNPSLARIGGFASPEEMIESATNLNQGFFTNEDDRIQIGRLMQEHGLVEGFETTGIRQDGKIIWISINFQTICDDKKKPLFIEGTIQDVTERKSHEKALYESELKYRNVVENSLVAFYIIQDGLFRFVNTHFCAITGYSYDEVVDTLGPLDLIHLDDRERIEKTIRDHLQGKNTESEYEVKITKKDGATRTVKNFKNLIIYNGRPAYFVSAIDVTKERHLEAKLLQAQKMEAIGTLTGGIAHDFNNILTALMGYGTLLQMKMDDSDPLKRYAEQMLSASEKAANLTQSLLAFSRLQPVACKPININSVVLGTEKLLRRLVTEDITLLTDLSQGQIKVLADPTQIDQILFNLVVNARDAMPKGGILKIMTKTTELDQEFILNNGFGKHGTYAVLSVSDNGMGMDEKTRQRIFEPFFTTKDTGKGTGLGLSTVYGIVKQNYGYIAVKSDPGKGTIFHIYIPLINADIVETQKMIVDFQNGEETILVADDNKEVRSYIKDILGQYGYEVIEAEDGEDAINKFNEHGEISLVILDSVMPKKNGKDVFDSMKKIRPGILSLFMSGYPKEVVLAKGVIEDGIEFISKPLAAVEFMIKVRKILDKKK